MSILRFSHEIPPEDYKLLLEYIEREFAGVSASIDSVGNGEQDVLSVPPERVYTGMSVYADGTNWNPDGSGREGQYVYSSSGQWVYQFGSGGNISVNSITFPATQVPSANANTLDDYEEGTWTPTLTFATPGNLSVVYLSRLGTYTKIGRVVDIRSIITTSSFVHTTSSGIALVTGLPFPGGLSFYPIAWGLAAGITYGVDGQIGAMVTTSQVQFYGWNNSTGGNAIGLSTTQFPSGTNKSVYLGGTYSV